jgi:S1-C subfamily serine protease
VVVVTIAAAGFASAWRTEASIHGQLATQQRTVQELRQRLDAAQTDWSAIAATAESSVVTVEAGDSLGSGWVAHSDANSSEIVTNFHVVADSWSSGTATVSVRQGDRTSTGTIERVDRNDDLAVIRLAEHLPALAPAAQRPKLGTTVMAVGSSLGLEGTSRSASCPAIGASREATTCSSARPSARGTAAGR